MATLTLSASDSSAVMDFLTGRAASRGSTTRTLYAALVTSATPSGTTTAGLLSTEITTAGYARQAVTWTSPAQSSGTTESHNSGTLTFGPFTADPPAVAACVLVDSSTGTGGTVEGWIPLTTSVDAGNGDSITVAAAALQQTVPYQT